MAWEERISIFTMFGCILVLTGVVAFLIGIIIQERRNYAYHLNMNRPFQAQVHVPMEQTNRLFNGYEDVDFVCISMTHRKASHFESLRKTLAHEKLELAWFQGINGKNLDMNDYPLQAGYRAFFHKNQREREQGSTQIDYRGHLGCTLSHLNIISQIKNMTVILEDDAKLVPNFRQEFQARLAAVTQLDPDWEILLLGFCSKFEYHPQCKRNDHEPIMAGGIARIHYWIGGWGYCIRNAKVAQKIIREFFSPIPWHIDLTLAQNAFDGKLKVYGCLPPIAKHQGLLRLSSWDYHQVGDSTGIKSDTTHTIPDYVL